MNVTEWEKLPDLGLYMDQTVSFIEAQMSDWASEDLRDTLTASMINNYAKKGLIPRPDHRKYYREHIALLLMIAFLKNTLSMDEIEKIFRLFPGDVQAVYRIFAEALRDEASGPAEPEYRENLLRSAVRVNGMQLRLREEIAKLPGTEEEIRETAKKDKTEKKNSKKTAAH